MSTIPDLSRKVPPIEPTPENLAELESDRVLGENMLRGYADHWRRDFEDFDVLGVEEAFILPVVNPASDRASRYYQRAGVLDLRLRRRSTGGIVIVDHKTAQGGLDEFRNHLEFDEQVSGYWSAVEARDGTPVETFAYNVLDKAFPKPPRIVKASKAEACACGRDLLTDPKGKPVPHTLSVAQNQVTTAALYRATMAGHGIPGDSPQFAEFLAALDREPRAFFQREYLYRTPARIGAYLADLYECSREMRVSRPYANPSLVNCRSCEFRAICISDTPEGRSLYRQSENRHEEIDEDAIADANPNKDILSYSEIRTWKQCRRKHQFRYVDGLRPAVEARALRFGVGIHRALAEWYKTGGKSDMPAVWNAWFSAERERLTGIAPAPF